MTKKLINNLCNLIFDKDFQALCSRCSPDSVFEIVKMDENRKSNILSWLLSPVEAHQLGDYFLRALLNYACSTATTEQLKFFSSRFSIANISLSSARVLREVNIKNGRIDIAIFIPNEKTLIIIERKDGTTVHNSQLSKYTKWANDNYNKWRKLFILSDSHLRHHEEYEDSYIHIDDTWLVDALEDIIDRRFLNPKQEHQLKELYHYVFGTWSEKFDPFYKDLNTKLKELSKNHCNTIRQLEESYIKLGHKNLPFISVSPDKYFSKILPENKVTTNELKICELIQKHFNVFEQLHGLNEFDAFEDKLHKMFINFETLIYYDSLVFAHKRHIPKNDNDYWPYCLEFMRRTDEKGKVYYELSVHACRKNPEGFHGIATNVANFYKMPLQSNWRFRCSELISGIDKLELKEGTELIKEIRKFSKLVEGIESPMISY